jgi:predicted ATPase
MLELGGLGCPPPAGVIANRSYDALTFFEQSARRVQPRFTLADNFSAVAHICQLLDGNPLAIELSAAWVRLHETPEIAQQIEQDLNFLATRMRDVSERHRSLRAVFLHSWDLLNQAEQLVLRQLAVFRGGFTAEAAAVVTGATPTVLRGLIDHSLLLKAGPERHDLHLLVHQFAAEQLAAEESLSEGTAGRHADYYAGFLSRRLASLKSAGQQQALNEIAQESENSRRAWNWLAHHQRAEEIEQCAETLYHFYNIRSQFQEGIDLFAEAVSELDQNPPQPWLKSLAKVLACQGALAFRARQNSLGLAALEQARAIFEQ